MGEFPRLHDATLRSIGFDWESGEARLVCETASGPVAIIATAVSELKCSRMMPWGPSDSINEALLIAKSDAKMLRVEMQSGDQIEITCNDAVVSDLNRHGLAK